MTKNYYRNSLLVLAVLIFAFAGCSKRINSKFVGKYSDEKNPSLYIQMNEDGSCSVVSNSGRNSNRMFWCSMDGDTISLSLMRDELPYDEGVIYPEFRGKSAILTIDRDALITQTGRRFSRSGTSSSSSTSSSSTSSTSGVLTTEKAQNAVNKFASANGSGRITIKGGVQEIPSQNAAVAKLNVDDFTDKDGKQYKGKEATATFTHYTDGKWVMTKVEISLGAWNGSVKWDTQTTVQ